jgi:hypothetical protein
MGCLVAGEVALIPRGAFQVQGDIVETDITAGETLYKLLLTDDVGGQLMGDVAKPRSTGVVRRPFFDWYIQGPYQLPRSAVYYSNRKAAIPDWDYR